MDWLPVPLPRRLAMARIIRAEIFNPREVAVLHLCARVCRRCFLLGDDPFTQKNFDHRKNWVEGQLKVQAAAFLIDLITLAVMSNHIHLVLRSRPDVVDTWDDREVARRWLMICPNAAMLGTQLFVVSPTVGGDAWRVGICLNINVS
jgi:hypothetical protein